MSDAFMRAASVAAGPRATSPGRLRRWSCAVNDASSRAVRRSPIPRRSASKRRVETPRR